MRAASGIALRMFSSRCSLNKSTHVEYTDQCPCGFIGGRLGDSRATAFITRNHARFENTPREWWIMPETDEISDYQLSSVVAMWIAAMRLCRAEAGRLAARAARHL